MYAYALNPAHEHGGPKAYYLKTLLGIDADRGEELRAALIEAARHGEATAGRPSPYGKKYEIRFSMTGPRGTHTDLSVWMVRKDEDRPRLITVYLPR